QPSVGGQEMFFKGLCKALSRRGHQIDVYCIGHEQGLDPLEIVEGIAVHRSPMIDRYKSPRIPAMKRNWLGIIRFALQVRKVARADPHDAYLLNQWPFLHVLLLPRSIRQRSLLHWCEVRQARFYRMCQKHLPRLVGMNAAISDSVAAKIGEVSGCAA